MSELEYVDVTVTFKVYKKLYDFLRKRGFDIEQRVREFMEDEGEEYLEELDEDWYDIAD